jgi:hypothetical membrane protein
MKKQTTLQINNSSQRNALYAFFGAYLLSLILTLIMRATWILNNVSLGFTVISISFIVPLVALIYYGKGGLGTLEYSKRASKYRIMATSTIVILAFSIASMAAGTGIAIIFAKAFKEFTYDPFSFSFWVAFATAAWIYVYTSFAQRIKVQDIINMIGFYLIGGVTASAIFNPNPQWWDESVSYLGMNQLPSAKLFNFCIIFSGILLLSLSSFIIGEFNKLFSKNLLTKNYLNLYRVAFVLAPIGLTGVGLFPYGSSPLHSTLHNSSAFLAFGLFGIVMASLYFSMKFLSKYFLRINYLLFAILAGGYGLYQIHYFTLAIVEIFAFGIISLWLVLFLGNVSAVNDENRG